MAKSLRSKWKRKMRAIKRIRYGVKELKQLKSVLQNLPAKKLNLSDLCTVVKSEAVNENQLLQNTVQKSDEILEAVSSAEGLKASTSEREDVPDKSESKLVLTQQGPSAVHPANEIKVIQSGADSQTETMEVDSKTRYHRVKLTDEHGNYPVWMNQRAIKKHKAKLKRLGRVQKKRKHNKKTK